MKKKSLLVLFVFFSSPTFSQDGPNEPLYRNSIVSTSIDFITAEDACEFQSLNYSGQGQREMPDKRSDELMDENAFVFEAIFKDATIFLWAHSSFQTREAAEAVAEKLLCPLARLPKLMRTTLSHVVIHNGDEGAFAEHLGHFFVLYSKNMETRIRDHDLEETVFHESVHATLDAAFADDAAWHRAQRDDAAFVTHYAQENPEQEDLAESALFAYTLALHPERLPEATRDWLRMNIPNRLAFVEKVFKLN